MALQCFGQSCRAGDLGEGHGRTPTVGCPLPRLHPRRPGLGGREDPTPAGLQDPCPAPRSCSPAPADSRGPARTLGWLRRVPAAPAPLGSGQPDCRTSWRGSTGLQAAGAGTPTRPRLPSTQAQREGAHLLAASWSRSRRSSIFLCSWDGRVKAAAGPGAGRGPSQHRVGHRVRGGQGAASASREVWCRPVGGGGRAGGWAPTRGGRQVLGDLTLEEFSGCGWQWVTGPTLQRTGLCRSHSPRACLSRSCEILSPHPSPVTVTPSKPLSLSSRPRSELPPLDTQGEWMRGKDTVSSRALAITKFSIICRCRDRV